MTHLSPPATATPSDGADAPVPVASLPATSPFARPWDLPLGLPDFAAVAHEDIEPAVRAGMAAERAEWEAVATDPREPTVANTVEALEGSGDLLNRAMTVLGSLTSATYCPDLDALEEALAPELAAHHDAYQLDPRLYGRLKHLDALGEGATDADGRYRWDVPAGLYKVVYTKEGYENAESEVLTIPPRARMCAERGGFSSGGCRP